MDKVEFQVAIANLRVQCFAALKSWGSIREDGKWAAWDYGELRKQADDMAVWALGDLLGVNPEIVPNTDKVD